VRKNLTVGDLGDLLDQPLVAVLATQRTDGTVLLLWVPKTSSTSRDQVIFVDRAVGARLPSDAVLLKIDRFG
jgi:hypothetical protein